MNDERVANELIEKPVSNSYIIYVFTNINNAKRYVGQTEKTFEQRWYKHQHDALRGNRNTAFCGAIRKHGASAFTYETIETGLTLDEANLREQFWIAELDTLVDNGKGYNQTLGGGNVTGIFKMSKASCEKISASKRGKLLTGRRARTQEEDRPIVEAYKTGKTRDEVSRQLGVTFSKVHKALIRWKERVEPDFDLDDHRYERSGNSLKCRADEINQPVIDALLTGLSYKEAALKLNVSVCKIKTAIQRYRKRCIEQNIEIPRVLQDKHDLKTQELSSLGAHVVSLFNKGLTRRQISERLNINYDAVKGAIRRHTRQALDISTLT